MARKSKADPEPERLAGFKILERFSEILGRHDARRSKSKRELDPRRNFDARGYFSMLLFTLINPVIDSMRGLCAVSGSERYREKTGLPKVSLGSFSEAQSVFDPVVLRGVLRELISRADTTLPEDLRKKLGPISIQAIDSTLWEVLGRMGWARWRNQYSTKQKAVRLHVCFNLLGKSNAVAGAEVTEGRECERRIFRHDLLEPESVYVGDRNYSWDYTLLERIQEIGSDFVVRLRDESVIEELDALPIGAQERTAGITHHLRVALGHSHAKDCGWRLVRLVKPNGHYLMILTSIPAERLGALEICEIYRQRWAIEGFFRWLKCTLPCRHWLAESQAGVTSQIYCALIAALMLTEQLGKLPTKRQLEAIRWWMIGWLNDEELTERLGLCEEKS